MNKLHVLLLTFFALTYSALAQNPPTHTRIISQHSLSSADEPNNLGVIEGFNTGTFTDGGWKADKQSSKLKISFNPLLPQEGTLEIMVKGLMPAVTNDWDFLSLWSREAGAFTKVKSTPGSFVMFKADEGAYNLGIHFKFLTSSFFGNETGKFGKSEVRLSQPENTNAFRTVKIVWNQSNIWLMIDGKVMTNNQVPHIFSGQIENFAYMFLGQDNEYIGNRGALTFKELKIYGPSTNYPFSNVAVPKGVSADTLIGNQGVTVSDLDGDGNEDLLSSRFFNLGYSTPNLLYMSGGDGSYTEEGSARGVADDGYTYQSVAGDFDNDGDNDIFYANFGGQKTLLLNNGTGSFSNATASKIIGNSSDDTKSLTLLDLENDGDLDVIVLNKTNAPEVFVNDGSARFTKTDRGLGGYSTSAGSPYQSINVADVNNDRFQDILLVRQDGAGLLLMNNKSGSFFDAGGLVYSGPSSGSAFGDIDNDGDMDLAIFETKDVGAKTRIFRNDGLGNFHEIQNIPANAFGGVFADWNNDADLDLYISQKNDLPGLLYVNDGTGNFVLASGSGVENQLKDGRGSAILDYDNDGDMDIYAVARGGEFLGRRYSRNFLYRNDANNANNWIKVAIYNDNDAIAGIGSKIWVYEAGYLSGNTSKRLIGFREVVGTHGFLSQSSWVQHVGVAENTVVDVRVQFPNGDVQEFKNQPVNNSIEIRPSTAVPASFVVENDNQAGKAGSPLPQPIKVLVLNEFSSPAANVPVAFSVTAGSGTINGATNQTILTDATGYAQVQWTMGATAGVQNQLRISVTYNGQHLPNSPYTISTTPVANDPAMIRQISGNNQNEYIGKPLPQPLVVEVTDAFNNKIADFPVTFNVDIGGGQINGSPNSATVNTGANGQAQANWQLGLIPGQQRVQAVAQFNGAHLQNSPVNFVATAKQPDLRLTKVSGDSQTTVVGQALPAPFTVRVTNNFDQPVENRVVYFQVITGNGGFDGPDSALTDADGYASRVAVAGPTAGQFNNRYTASVPDAAGSPVTFVASATAGPAARIDSISGGGQTGKVNTQLSEDFVVRVLDQFGNPVPGHNVTYSVTQGLGRISGGTTGTLQTDVGGYARARLTLGQKVDTTLVVFSADGLAGSPVAFPAYSQPSDPFAMTEVDGNNQKGVKGTPLTRPFRVKVKDQFDNLISGHPVTFQVVEGDGTFSGANQITISTDSDGIASALLTCGAQAYRNVAWATSEFNGTPLLNSPIAFEATTGPGDPDSVVVVSGNNQRGKIGTVLAEPFIVKVKDKNNVGVPNIEVEFFAITPGASFGGEQRIKRVTDENGLAEATGTIGDVINTYNFQAAARFNGVPLAGSPITFRVLGRKSRAVRIERFSDSLVVNNAGTQVTDVVAVRCLDDRNNAVAGQPVMFSRTSGHIWILNNGSLTNSVEVLSNENGIASISVRYYERPEVAQIEATANDGVNALQGSGIIFSFQGVVGPPSPLTSTFSVPDTVAALGDSAWIDIVLRDAYDNPVPGKTVFINHQTNDIQQLIITNPNQPTDSNGQARGMVQSFDVGQVILWGRVDNIDLPADTIHFVPGPPTIVDIIDNYRQVGLNEQVPIKIRVNDQRRHPIPGIQVTFNPEAGNMVTPQPVVTDNKGEVTALWQTPNSLGEKKVLINVNGMDQPGEFFAFVVVSASKAVLSKVSGDSLIGLINQELPEKFIVSLTDSSGVPIVGETVVFETPNGGSFTSQQNQTDVNGQAWAQFKAGSTAGEYKVRAKVTSLGKVVEFVCYIQAERGVALFKRSEDLKDERPFTPVVIQAQALDPFNRPVANILLALQVTAGGGSVDKSEAITDINGRISATWTLGSLGNQNLVVSAKDMAGSVQFSYTVVNSAPELSQPSESEFSVVAGEILSIPIVARDADNDDVTYSASPMPPGATLSEWQAGVWALNWTPAEEQVGQWAVTIYASDAYGARDSTTINIQVLSSNHPPYISVYTPSDTIIFVKQKLENGVSSEEFWIHANDDDREPVYYNWYLPYTTLLDTTFLIRVDYTRLTKGSNYWIKVVVTDGKDSVSHTWRLDYITVVELSSFQADETTEGVRLTWSTSSESGNLGFQVLRSETRSGPYEQISGAMIESSSSGKYQYVDRNVLAGTTYFYKLRDLDKNGAVTEHGPIRITVSLPTELRLSQNYPNPFNPTTTIVYDLPEQSSVQLEIFNLSGQIVKTLVNEDKPAGSYKVVWNATDEMGTNVPTGIYYYRLRAGDRILTKKLLLLK